MLQETGAPDLIKFLPWWAPYLIAGAISVYAGAAKLRRKLQSADAAEEEKYKARLAKELEPYLKRLEHAEKYAALLEKENGQLQDELRAEHQRLAEREARIARYLDDEVEAQKKMARVLGQCAELEKRVAEMENELNAPR